MVPRSWQLMSEDNPRNIPVLDKVNGRLKFLFNGMRIHCTGLKGTVAGDSFLLISSYLGLGRRMDVQFSGIKIGQLEVPFIYLLGDS
jgi:hypothetical protein